MPATSPVRNIPLNRLVLSPTNVRKTPPSVAEEAELKASIRAGGLKQNLVVHPSTDDESAFAVTAGGRRLKALQELAAEGAIAADHKVPCLVETADAALETSLMENTVRAAMHPADEFAAMAALIDAGQTVEAVAIRFGVTEQRVRQRLRLGKVAPELLDQFRAGAITLEVVMAFTLGADHAAQLAVWEQIKEQHYLSAHTVRRLLTASAIPVDSDLGAFVGLDAYEAAGGTVTRDLFSTDEDGVFLDDAALVRRLAVDKLEAKATELRADWAWAKPELDPEYGFTAQYGRVQPQPAEYPPEIAAELDRIERRLAEIEEIPEDEWSDELAAEAAQISERHDELIETTEANAVYAAKDRAIAGCIVTIGDEGEFRIYEGLVDRSTHPAAGGSNHSGTDADGDDTGDDANERDEPFVPEPSREQLVRKECGFSQGLVDDLKAHRQQITRAHLAGDFGVAFDLALYAMCVDLLAYRCRSHPLSLRATETSPRSSLNDLAGTPADRLLQAHEKALDTSWLSLKPGEAFTALSALPAESKQRLFAWCVAATLEPQLAIEDQADPVLECAGRRLAIPFADCWRPTAANYWGRVKKAHGLGVAKEVLGPRWARDHADDKKAILATALQTAFDPAESGRSIGLDQATRDSAAAWLPPGMAYSGELKAPDFTDHEFGAASVERDPPDGDVDADDPASSDLPAFLTDDEPNHARLNGASAR